MDLPFTQKRWCGAAGIDQVTTLSDQLHADFGSRYGCLLKEMRILRRAVFVVGRDGKVAYADYMAALGDEPRYDDVLAAVKKALCSSSTLGCRSLTNFRQEPHHAVRAPSHAGTSVLSAPTRADHGTPTLGIPPQTSHPCGTRLALPAAR